MTTTADPTSVTTATTATAPAAKDPLRVLRNLDLVLLAIALPVFLAAGFPILGWLGAAAVWGMWRGIGEFSNRKAHASDDPRQVAGIAAGSMIGRGWLLGLTLLGVGLIDNAAGLAASLLAVALFTIHFSFGMAVPPVEVRSSKSS